MSGRPLRVVFEDGRAESPGSTGDVYKRQGQGRGRKNERKSVRPVIVYAKPFRKSREWIDNPDFPVYIQNCGGSPAAPQYFQDEEDFLYTRKVRDISVGHDQPYLFQDGYAGHMDMGGDAGEFPSGTPLSVKSRSGYLSKIPYGPLLCYFRPNCPIDL